MAIARKWVGAVAPKLIQTKQDNTTTPSFLSNIASKWRQAKQVVEDVINSPEAKFIQDSWQLQKMAEINADNHIGPAFENVVYNLNRYYRTSPGWMDRVTTATDVSKAVDEYNKALQIYWASTSWWPKNKEWKFRWQDYMKYKDNMDNAPIQYQYVVEWDKWNMILWWQPYQRQKFKFQFSGADLIKQMNSLSGQYNNQLNLRKENWQRWNKLVQEWKQDTKEAKALLDEYFKYNNQSIDTLNKIRAVRDVYVDLVSTMRSS